MNIKNDGSLMFHIVKHIKAIAEDSVMEVFVCWFVANMIIPYSNQQGRVFQNDFYTAIGFKKEPTIDKVFTRLKLIELI